MILKMAKLVFFLCQLYPQNRWKSQYCSKTANRRVTRPTFLNSARPCASKLLFLLFSYRVPFFFGVNSRCILAKKASQPTGMNNHLSPTVHQHIYQLGSRMLLNSILVIKTISLALQSDM